MGDHFAVIDVGSNAMRWQIAAVDHPKHYRIVAQDRQPVRLGRQVFQTGKLNAQEVDAALRVFKDFRAAADRYRAKAMRAAGTSALREASDSRKFINRARAVGIPLEVRSEEHTSELQSQSNLVCRLLLEKKNELRVREGKSIETTSRCSDSEWMFHGTTLRFSREIATAVPDTPMPLVLQFKL